MWGSTKYFLLLISIVRDFSGAPAWAVIGTCPNLGHISGCPAFGHPIWGRVWAAPAPKYLVVVVVVVFPPGYRLGGSVAGRRLLWAA